MSDIPPPEVETPPGEQLAEEIDLPKRTMCRCGERVGREIEELPGTEDFVAVWGCSCGRTRFDHLSTARREVIDTEWR